MEQEITVMSEPFVTDYRFKTKPKSYQLEAFHLSRGHEAFALFMEQGTGKTKVAIDTAAWLKQQDEIDAVFIVCPHQMILTWTDIEIPLHLPEHIAQFSKAVPWNKQLAKKYEQSMDGLYPHTELGLRFLVINPESLIQKDAFQFCERFVRTNKTLMIIDESQSIKNESSKRTRAVMKLKPLTAYRRILTGTPIANNILDLYPQMRFLDEEILGYYSYYAFRNHFAIVKRVQFGHMTRSFDKVVGYQNTTELKRLVDKRSFRVLKNEVLDIPDKVYETRLVELTAPQRRVYDEMKRSALAQLSGAQPQAPELDMEFDALESASDSSLETPDPNPVVTAVHAAVQLLKLHQIASGWVRDDQRKIVSVADPNPKLDALLGIIEDELQPDQKVIIWANYRHDIELIEKTLQEKYGPRSAAKFYGGMKRETKQQIITNIQTEDSDLRFMVGHPKAGGSGVTLTGASVVIYYSNSHNLIDRLQSEDRCHRLGQTKSVLYIDIVAAKTVDVKILQALQSKVDLAKTVVKMDYRELQELFS